MNVEALEAEHEGLSMGERCGCVRFFANAQSVDPLHADVHVIVGDHDPDDDDDHDAGGNDT